LGKLDPTPFCSAAQKASIQLEKDKFDLERDKAAIDLFRLVLSNPDADHRKAMMEFIDARELLIPEVDSDTQNDPNVPQWPAPPEESP
jgi:hypothetical protein